MTDYFILTWYEFYRFKNENNFPTLGNNTDLITVIENTANDMLGINLRIFHHQTKKQCIDTNRIKVKNFFIFKFSSSDELTFFALKYQL